MRPRKPKGPCSMATCRRASEGTAGLSFLCSPLPTCSQLAVACTESGQESQLWGRQCAHRWAAGVLSWAPPELMAGWLSSAGKEMDQEELPRQENKELVATQRISTPKCHRRQQPSLGQLCRLPLGAGWLWVLCPTTGACPQPRARSGVTSGGAAAMGVCQHDVPPQRCTVL